MIFRADGIEFTYRSTPVLKGVTLDVEKGEIVTLLGPNGVGKTTFLKCLNKVLAPLEGSVFVEDVDLNTLSRRDTAKMIGYVPQKGDISRMTVFDAVLLGRRPHIEWDASEKDLRLTSRVLDLMGLSSMSLKNVDEISGGEYQMVQIARAVVQQPRIILMDEPTSNLDISNQHMIMNTIRNIIKKNKMAAVMTIHDLNLAVRYSDKFVLMHDGAVHAAGDHEVLTPSNIKAVYHIDAYVENIKGIPVIIPK